MNRTRPIIALCMCFAICAAAGSARAQPGRWDAPATALADQIAAICGPGPATLVVENASAIPTDQVPPIRRLFEADLRSAGVNVRAGVEGTAIPTALRITLSQNAREALWVAQVQQGDDTRVAMITLPLASAGNTPPATTMTLRKQLLLQSSDPVLDVQTTADGTLLALGPARIAIYRQNAGAWQQTHSFTIAPIFTSSIRDPRGELTASGDSLTAFLPGAQCDSAAGLTFTCRASDDPWPIGAQKAFYNASRDYFSGVLVPATTAALPPFYSAAEVAGPGGLIIVLADIHGHARLLDRGALVDLPGSRDWGSDLASIRSGCGAGTQLLVDAAGDPLHDSLRAYEIDGHEAHAVSAPLDLDGAVSALHPTSDGTAATAVLHNSNGYEVWHVALDCR